MARKTKNDDAKLLAGFAAGDEDAFRQLVGQYKDSLYPFLRRFLNQNALVEDVFQETFLQLYASRESFDTSRPLKPWLFTIAANKARDALRKIQRTPAITVGQMADASEASIDDVFNSITSYETTPYAELEKDEAAKKVREIVSEMPDNLKEILILAYFEQFSYKQMAEILSIPIGTVKSRLHTAVVHFGRQWRSLSRDFDRDISL